MHERFKRRRNCMVHCNSWGLGMTSNGLGTLNNKKNFARDLIKEAADQEEVRGYRRQGPSLSAYGYGCYL